MEAKWSGVRKSRPLTLQLTSSAPHRARTRAVVFKSDRQTASTSCWPKGAAEGGRARNSLFSYLVRIHRSFSSRLDCGLGLTPLIRASQMLLLTVLPSPNMTAMCPGLQQEQFFKISSISEHLSGRSNLRPFIEVQRTNARNVRAQVPVDARAFDAD